MADEQFAWRDQILSRFMEKTQADIEELRRNAGDMNIEIQLTASKLSGVVDRFESALAELQPLVTKMSEAKGAWRMLILVAAIGAGIGAILTWLTTTFAKLLGH
jgi:hypothetical protein